MHMRVEVNVVGESALLISQRIFSIGLEDEKFVITNKKFMRIICKLQMTRVLKTFEKHS